MLDTIYTLEAMNTDVFVIRDSEAGMPEFLIDHVATRFGNQRWRGARVASYVRVVGCADHSYS